MENFIETEKKTEKKIKLYSIDRLINEGKKLERKSIFINIIYEDNRGEIIKEKITNFMNYMNDINNNVNDIYINNYDIKTENDIIKCKKICDTINDYIENVYKKLTNENIKNKENYYENIIEHVLNNNDIDKEMNKIINYYNCDDAIKYYLLAIKKGSIDAIFIMGDIYENIYMYKNALKYYAHAIINGNNNGYISIGDVYLKKGYFDVAKIYYKIAITKGINMGYIKIGKMYEYIYEYIKENISDCDKGIYNINKNKKDNFIINEYNYETLNKLYKKSNEYYKIAYNKDKTNLVCLSKMIEYLKWEKINLDNLDNGEINKKNCELIIEYSKKMIIEKNKKIENKDIINVDKYRYIRDIDKNKYNNKITDEAKIFNKFDFYIDNIEIFRNKYEIIYYKDMEIFVEQTKRTNFYDIAINYVRIQEHENAIIYANLEYYEDIKIFDKLGYECIEYKWINQALRYYELSYIRNHNNSCIRNYDIRKYKNFYAKVESGESIAKIFIRFLDENEKQKYILYLIENNLIGIIYSIYSFYKDNNNMIEVIKYAKIILDNCDYIIGAQILDNYYEYGDLIYMMCETMTILINKYFEQNNCIDSYELYKCIINNNYNKIIIKQFFAMVEKNITEYNIVKMYKMIIECKSNDENLNNKIYNTYEIQEYLKANDKEYLKENNKECLICFKMENTISMYKCKTIKHEYCINCIKNMNKCPLCKSDKYNKISIHID
jgi:hypothetical protein